MTPPLTLLLLIISSSHASCYFDNIGSPLFLHYCASVSSASAAGIAFCHFSRELEGVVSAESLINNNIKKVIRTFIVIASSVDVELGTSISSMNEWQWL